MSVRHFLSFMDYSPEELIGLIRRGSERRTCATEACSTSR